MCHTVIKWLPTRFLQGSLIFQFLVLAFFIYFGGLPPQILYLCVLNHLLIAGVCFWPQSGLFDPNITRLSKACDFSGKVALTFDDGPNPETTPEILEILDTFDAKATFFCIAEQAEKHPNLIREIVARGHSIGNHSYKHQTWFAFLSVTRLRGDIQKSQGILTAITHQRPRFFRAPFGIRNPWLEPILSENGLKLVSWSRRGFDAVIKNEKCVERLLTRGIRAGEIVLMHDGYGRTHEKKNDVALVVLPKLLEVMKLNRLVGVSLDLDQV